MKTDKVIEALNRSTKSPGKGYGAEENLDVLIQRISPQKNKLSLKRYISAAAASVAIMFVIAGTAITLYKQEASHNDIAIEKNLETLCPNFNTENKTWYFENSDITEIFSQLSAFYQININMKNYKTPRYIRAEFTQDDEIYEIISLVMFAAGCEYKVENENSNINILIEN